MNLNKVKISDISSGAVDNNYLIIIESIKGRRKRQETADSVVQKITQGGAPNTKQVTFGK